MILDVGAECANATGERQLVRRREYVAVSDQRHVRTARGDQLASERFSRNSTRYALIASITGIMASNTRNVNPSPKTAETF